MGFVAITRLRIMRGGKAAYDQEFHLGVNIIRGENGSGKSTLMDAIFFVLGGEFDAWKDAARKCDEIQAELVTTNGRVSVRRRTVSRKEAPLVFFGAFEESLSRPLDDWRQLPLARTQGSESYSQVLFKAIGIPEAPSQGSANVTMHQILRLMYSDQQTPAPRLFRFERFDTRDIREAVGNLLIGVESYTLYDAQLLLRQLKGQYEEARSQLEAYLGTLPANDATLNLAALDAKVRQLHEERGSLRERLESADHLVPEASMSGFLEERKKALNVVSQTRAALRKGEDELEKLGLDIEGLETFSEYLRELAAKLEGASAVADLIGAIEFTHCPACLSELRPPAMDHTCHVCHSELPADDVKDRYLSLRLDITYQLRESRQLLEEKSTSRARIQANVVSLRRSLSAELTSFSSKYDMSNSPRESFLAETNMRLGQLEREIEYLEETRGKFERIAELSGRKEELQGHIGKLEAVIDTEQRLMSGRVQSISRAISDRAASLLRSDLRRQEEFEEAQNVVLSFDDDAIFVDGRMNFAESSNVILKNSAILALFLTSLRDEKMSYPRFCLMDNIEDKGMEEARSHNFQELIVEACEDIEKPFQLIFSTSTISPKLEGTSLTVGPAYSRANRVLA